MLSDEARSDNLEEIKGIGPDAREWLAETFSVRTFAALADLPAEDLVNRIKAENKPWLRWAKNWPADAAARAAEIEADTKARQPAAASSREQKDGWEALAYYVIEFQSRQRPGEPVEERTTVSYQGPGPETLPVAIGRDDLCEWIFDHLHGILPDQLRGNTRGGARAMSDALRPEPVSVSQLYLFQPAGARAPLCSFGGEQPRVRLVTADQPFDLQAIMEEREPEVSENGPIAIEARFRVREWDTGEDIDLGSVRARAIEGQPGYSALLQGICLARGKYWMQVLALAHPEPEEIGSLDIRMLNVW